MHFMDMDIKNFDRDSGMPIAIDPKDTVNLNFKPVIHEKCGRKHIDQEKFATFNHRKHLCHHCNEYFYDCERGIGI